MDASRRSSVPVAVVALVAAVGRAVDELAGMRRHGQTAAVGPRVLGLGAPVSVQITLSRGEQDLLRGELVKQLKRAVSQRQGAERGGGGSSDERAWREML